MIKYRPQRGSLADAMKESKSFINIADMLLFIEMESDGYYSAADIVIMESNGVDERIHWNSWRYVCVTKCGSKVYDSPQCIGYCDLGEKG